MTVRSWRAGSAAVALGVIVLLTGCSQAGEQTSAATGASRTSVDKGSLRQVLLPDLAGMSESVRRQVRERHSSLMLTIENPETTSLDLGKAYGEMGKLFMAAQHLDAAEACYLNAQALTPEDARWVYYLGHVYRTRNDLVKAAAYFERTLELRSNDLAALTYLGDAYLVQGRPDAAIPPLSRALSLEPRLAVALFGLGRVALAKRDYAGAVRHLEQALALDPQASTIHYPLAMAYRGLGERDKAEDHLRQRGQGKLGFLPDPLMQDVEEGLANAQAFEMRGTKSLERGEWAAAARYLRRGVDLAPDNPAVHLKLAEALRQAGLPQESLSHYEQAIDLDPRTSGATARFGYAMALVRLRRYQDARDRLIEGMRVHPDAPAFPLALARLLAAAPDDDVRDGRQAMAMIHELLKEQQNTALGETMAMALAELERFDEAAALQRELIATTRRSGREDLVPFMAANLELYESRKASRAPWPDDGLP